MTHDDDHDGITERRATPLTEAQLALIAQETRRATYKSLHKHTRRATAGFLILFSAFLYNVYSLQQQDVKIAHASKAGRIAGIKESCKADRAFARSIDDALKGQIRFVIDANEPPPPTVDQRVQAINDIRVTLKGIPSCEERIARADTAAEDAFDGG